MPIYELRADGLVKVSTCMSYVTDTEFACRNLVELALKEDAVFTEMKARLATESLKVKAFKWDFETSDLHEDFSEAYVMNAFLRMSEAGKEANELEAHVTTLEASIGAKQLAIQALCGALLQIVKQGISLVHGSSNAAPPGRLLYGIPLRDIVWEARNQAVHCEEPTFRPPVTALFHKLAQAFGQDFDLAKYASQSRAKQVLLLLCWNDYNNLKKDMQLLGL